MLTSIPAISTGIPAPITYQTIAITGMIDSRPSQGTGRTGNYFYMWNASWQAATGTFPSRFVDRVRVHGTTNGQVNFACGSVNWSVTGTFDKTVEIGEVVDRVYFSEPASYRSAFTVNPQVII